jgi:hypothetical protein
VKTNRFRYTVSMDRYVSGSGSASAGASSSASSSSASNADPVLEDEEDAEYAEDNGAHYDVAQLFLALRAPASPDADGDGDGDGEESSSDVDGVDV